MSKKRFLIISLSILLLAAATALFFLLADSGLKRVDNEYLYTLDGEWEAAKDFSEGLAAVQTGGKWGFINTDGVLVIDPVYDGAFSFSEGLAAVRKGSRWGYIDKTGNTVIAFQYETTFAFSEGLAVYGEGLYYGYINNKGEKVTSALYSEASSFREGVACVRKGSAYAFLDKNGTPLTEFVYGESSKASEGLIDVFSDNGLESLKTAFIDLAGNVVLPPTWYDVKPFSEGLAAVQPEAFVSPWSFIDKTGKTVIEGTWDEVESFLQGRAAVHDSKGYYFIDNTGKTVSSLYGKAYSFTPAGLARVALADGAGWDFGYIRTDGSVAVELKYDGARDFYNGAGAVCEGGDWAFVNAEGKELCGFLWEDAGDFTEDGIARVRNGEHYGFVRLK